jgi:hypothetical protein
MPRAGIGRPRRRRAPGSAARRGAEVHEILDELEVLAVVRDEDGVVDVAGLGASSDEPDDQAGSVVARGRLAGAAHEAEDPGDVAAGLGDRCRGRCRA